MAAPARFEAPIVASATEGVHLPRRAAAAARGGTRPPALAARGQPSKPSRNTRDSRKK